MENVYEGDRVLAPDPDDYNKGHKEAKMDANGQIGSGAYGDVYVRFEHNGQLQKVSADQVAKL